MKKYDTELCEAIVRELTGDNYTPLGEYISSEELYPIRHNKCGATLDKIRFIDFKNGTRCNCERRKRVTYERINEYIRTKLNNTYTLLEKEEAIETEEKIANKISAILLNMITTINKEVEEIDTRNRKEINDLLESLDY